MYIAKMSWEEIERIQFDKSVLFLPIAPIEEHGPHLPAGVDCIIAEEACRRSSMKLQKTSSLKPYIFPLIPLGVAVESADFPGTISLPETLFAALIHQTLLNVTRWGFTKCVIVSPHASPAHLACIHAGIQLAQKECAIQIVEPLAQWVFGFSISNTSKRKEAPSSIPDIHAGEYETSMMLHLHPELVKSEKLPYLPERAIENMREPGTWKEKGAIEGYLGTPSKASEEKGKQYIQSLEKWADAALALEKHTNNELPPFISAKVAAILEKMKSYKLKGGRK
jgi:creatinine amidohydrolase